MLYKRVENIGITIQMTAEHKKLVFQRLVGQSLLPDKGVRFIFDVLK